VSTACPLIARQLWQLIALWGVVAGLGTGLTALVLAAGLVLLGGPAAARSRPARPVLDLRRCAPPIDTAHCDREKSRNFLG